MTLNPEAAREIKRVYLAGPDVFYPDARARGAAMVEICRQHGFVGLYPLDAQLDPQIQPLSLAIYQANRALIDRADAVVANLRDWRGHEPDSGTVWEVAYALAQGKPVIGYLPSNETLPERCTAIAPEGVDAEGCQVEDFGLPLNLMLAHSLTAVVCGAEENHAGLEAALERLQALRIL
jgi:nucleoside 2-deoxyribosyltransferase